MDFSVRGVTHEIKIKLSRNKGKKILINETATKKKRAYGNVPYGAFYAG